MKTSSFTYPFLLLFLLGTVSHNSLAQSYRCQKNGLTSYSQMPCQDGEQQTIKADPPTLPAYSHQQAKAIAAKEKAQAASLASSRHTAERKHEREMKAIAARNDKKKQQCDALALKTKWAKEDLARATPKAQAKAQLKLKRVGEKAALTCGK